MTDYLLFRLYGPMASWGDTAVGEYRPSTPQPGKSAVLGLVAAALGLERADETGLAALNRGYGFAVRMVLEGTMLRDYHTIQTPAPKKGSIFPTRRLELASDSVSTVLSSRDYRCDALYVACLWPGMSPPYSLETLAHALESPHFTLYLGRRACPPGLPLSPKVVRADTLREAFQVVDFPPLPAPLARSVDANADAAQVVYWEEGTDSGLEALRRTRRRDQLVHRKRWQFEDRLECLGRLPADTAPAGDKATATANGTSSGIAERSIATGKGG